MEHDRGEFFLSLFLYFYLFIFLVFMYLFIYYIFIQFYLLLNKIHFFINSFNNNTYNTIIQNKYIDSVFSCSSCLSIFFEYNIF